MKLVLPILLTCHMSAYLIGIGSIDFFEFLHGARDPNAVVHDRASVFGKKAFPPKIRKMCQN